MAKHNDSDDTKVIVNMRDYQKAHEIRPDEEPSSLFREEGLSEEPEELEDRERLKKMKVPKAVYRVGIILLALILGLALWLNRDSLQPERILNWVKLQFVGTGQGDGFPLPITGSTVSASNFTACDGNAFVLSDTALSAVSPSGKTVLSLRHSLNQPVLRSAYGKTLLYNWGSTSYMLLSGTELKLEGVSDRDIIAGAVAQSGRFALGIQGEDGASQLNVYQADGDLQSYYAFAKDYITAVAVNYDGTHGMVCTVSTEKGEIVSKVTVLDFNEPEPVASFESRNNLLLDAYWTEGGYLYAVGDSALLTASSSSYGFVEHSYGGWQLTAYRLDQGRAFLSISAYEHAGPSTLLIYREEAEPVRVESPSRITSISSFGGTAALLSGGFAVFCDYSTGEELGRAEAGSDAKSLALSNERTAYILGVSEIRTISIDS